MCLSVCECVWFCGERTLPMKVLSSLCNHLHVLPSSVWNGNGNGGGNTFIFIYLSSVSDEEMGMVALCGDEDVEYFGERMIKMWIQPIGLKGGFTYLCLCWDRRRRTDGWISCRYVLSITISNIIGTVVVSVFEALHADAAAAAAAGLLTSSTANTIPEHGMECHHKHRHTDTSHNELQVLQRN